jgi:hypothetical protein
MYHFGNGFLQPIVGVWDPPAPTPPPVLKLAPGTFTDVSVSALVDIVPAGGAVGLVARRAANGSSQYYGGISRTANGYTALIRLYRNGVWSTLASTPIASLSGRNTLKLDVIGTTLELSLNGNLLLSTPSGALKLAGATGTYSDVGGMIWPAAATSVSRPLAALPFTDGFAQADGTLLDRIAWNEWAGSFQAQNQVAIGQNSANLATLHSAAQPDVAQSVDVVHLPSGGSAGLLARYNVATDSFYRANLTATFSAKTNTTTYSAQIWRKQGAIWTRLASKTVSGTGTLTFVTVGGSQQLFLNGVLVASANDKMLLTGAYGIYASKGAGLDNYSAQSQALTIPALPFSDSFSAAGPALGVNWSPNAGVFSATGSQIVGGAAANIATLYKSVQTDSVQSVDVVSFAAGGFAGLVARSDASAGNLYRAGLTSVYNAATRTTTYFAQIWRKQGATWIKLASSAVGSGAGTLTFATVGASQQLFLNGVLVAASADTVLKTGTIGVFATQGATLDNFAANKPVFTVTGLPFSDSFTTGTTPGSNWYANAGAFTVTGNKLVGKTANNMLTLFGASKLDVSVQADISGLAGGVSAGVLARYNAVNGNTYWAGLVASHNASTGVTTYTAQIKRRVNGVWTVLFSKAAGTQAGLVRFEVTGSQLSLSLNGTLVGSVRDTVLSTAGTVGVSGGNGAQFGGFLAS